VVKRSENPIDAYIDNTFGGHDNVMQWIQDEADRSELPAISVLPSEGRLLQFLALAVGARKIVEIGTLAGYSGVWLARVLPVDGKLYSLEKSSKHAALARVSFERAGLSDKVQIIEGTALDSLQTLSSDGPFDFVFIDADKVSYPDYLAWAVENLRVGGMLAAHNALRGGRIVNPESDDDKGMAAFNTILAADQRLFSTIIAMGDGMAVAIKLA
jgi:caffeoyl-CoA O-methyltransferase